MFTMEGRRKIIGGDDYTPSIFFRQENDIKYYVTIKAKSGDSFKLALTKVITKITQLTNRLIILVFLYHRTKMRQPHSWYNR